KSDDLYDYIILKDAVLLKPATWMNRSANAVRPALKRWNISESLVVYDDLELPAGSMRVRSGGGDGGHNGIKSLFEVLPSDTLKRIRLGIDKDTRMDAAEYVLQKIPADQEVLIQPMLEKAVQLLDIYINRDFTAVLNEYSKWKKSYSRPKELES
ncbi:MAG: peptidyl-tRNA hydrolase, partial [Candidatus Cloacimonetes bacterium]|nr:peptidyl-tRNA hydrolase [Candidatus Cloacimonadota bacterium]